jgi:hypothetical protein
LVTNDLSRGLGDCDRECRRHQLRQLDACLEQLENAHERNQVALESDVAAMLRVHVPELREGMSISDAISLVLRRQEQHLRRARGVGAASGPARPFHRRELNEVEARALTERIRTLGQDVCILLVEAHERRAWVVLGHSTWEHYVRSELSMSRTRSYELLDQGRIILALAAAAGVPRLPTISAYAAEQIKPHLAEVLEIVRASTEGVEPHQVAEVVAGVVARRRAEIAAGERARRSAGGRRAQQRIEHVHAIENDVSRIVEAIHCLAGTAPAADVATLVTQLDNDAVAAVDAALRWLAQVSRELAQRRHDVASRDREVESADTQPARRFA